MAVIRKDAKKMGWAKYNRGSIGAPDGGDFCLWCKQIIEHARTRRTRLNDSRSKAIRTARKRGRTRK
jgi:hypothetical protein